MIKYMSINYVTLTSTRELGEYLSREKYNLTKMENNERVPESLLNTKVTHYNDLVRTLNKLMGALVGTSEPIFDLYGVETIGQAPIPVIESEPEIETKSEPELNTQHVIRDVPAWESDGYDSYAEWLSDKQAEGEVMRKHHLDDDVAAIGSSARDRASQLLDEYESTNKQDITAYDPEEDKAISVLPSELKEAIGTDNNNEDNSEDEHEDVETEDANETSNDSDNNEDSDEDDSDESNDDDTDIDEDSNEHTSEVSKQDGIGYMNHTVANERINDDPAQIAGVETAVERDGAQGLRGTEIDTTKHVFDVESILDSGLIDDDLLKLRVKTRKSKESSEE